MLTIINRFSRWPEAIPMVEVSTKSCLEAIIHGWFARFGIPLSITSDHGSQFCSDLFKRTCSALNIKINHTTAYHPQANGMIERFHRHLKQSLKCYASPDAWYEALPWVLLGIRSAMKEDLSSSSAEYVYGEPLAVPGQFLHDSPLPV